MNIVSIDATNAAAFVAYCSRYGAEHDDSFITDTALLPSDDYPGSMLLDKGEVVGAVCLVRTPPFLQAHKGRFLIFHTTLPGAEPYAMLFQSILPATQDLDFVYLFIPQTLQATGNLWEQLGFFIERRSYVLRHEDPGTPESSLPSGLHYRSLETTDDDAIERFCNLINLNFAFLSGHVDSSPEHIKSLITDPAYLPGGIMLLYDGTRPIGTLGLSVESTEPDTAFIEMLSLHSDYRGRGLGRALLRKAIRFSRANGYTATELSVNAENDTAVRLYVSEGFQQKLVMLCYRLNTR